MSDSLPAETIVRAQHEETGRMWEGPRSQLPPRFVEVGSSNPSLRDWAPPTGFVVERPEHFPDCVMVGRDGNWVTADLKKRIFGLGYAPPRQWAGIEGAKFSGPGWSRRLLDAAVEYLRAEVNL